AVLRSRSQATIEPRLTREIARRSARGRARRGARVMPRTLARPQPIRASTRDLGSRPRAARGRSPAGPLLGLPVRYSPQAPSMTPINLRSDTQTLPTPAMLEAIVAATLGDDTYDEDPTVARLEALAAERLGTEAALLVPSGHMGNLIALMVHARPGTTP